MHRYRRYLLGITLTVLTLVGVFIILGVGSPLAQAAETNDTAPDTQDMKGRRAPLIGTATCNGNNLEINITSGDPPINISTAFAAPGMPRNGVGVGLQTFVGPGNWQGILVEEAGADFDLIGLGSVECPPPAVALIASASCNGNNLDVAISQGDGPFNITGTGPNLPQNGVAVGTTTVNGPGAWTGVTVTETTGNTQSTNLGNWACPPLPLTATAICNGNNLEITITNGDVPINITAGGAGMPRPGVGLGLQTFNGPSNWTGILLTETSGDQQQIGLGSVACPPPFVNLIASATCNGNNLDVAISQGDGPFNISGTGVNLPQNGVAVGINPVNGPGAWTGVTVTETTGNTQSTNLGNFACPPLPLTANAICNGNNLEIVITNGDTPINISAVSGPGMPRNGVGLGTEVFAGPGTWAGILLTETTGDQGQAGLGTVTCPTPFVNLIASATCNGNNLDVAISQGDGPFNIGGTGVNLPQTGVAVGITPVNGPGAWTGVTVTETTGNGQTANLGNFNCPPLPLTVTAICNGNDLEINITNGDVPINITGGGPGMPRNGVGLGVQTFAGPGTWTGMIATETTGDQQQAGLGGVTCPVPTVPLAATANCVADNLVVNITAGDGPFNITGTGPGLPLNGVAAGSNPLTGPGTWTGVTVTETTGNTQSILFGDYGCATLPLVATAACVGNDLIISITTGDPFYNITGAGPGLPITVSAGILTLNGPGSWTGVTITEATGNAQSINFGNFNCPTVPLVASALCQVNDLVVTITAGDTPFNITGTGPGLPLNGVAAGNYTLTGPGTWTGVTVTETTGTTESTNLGTFNCGTNALTASAICMLGNLVVTITAGDTPFNITGTGPGLPLNGVAAGNYPLTGPGTWTGVTVTETTGNTESANLGTFNCATTNGLTASAVCNGPNLVVTISTGDTPFNIVGTGPGLPLNGVTAGAYTLTGPATWTAVDVAEAAGNLEVATLGNFTCTNTTPAIPGLAIPNLGLIRIGVEQAQPMYDAPGGSPITANGEKLLLPHDADSNGFDTYVVTQIVETSDGDIWLGIFIGGPTWVYVPLDHVTVIVGVVLP